MLMRQRHQCPVTDRGQIRQLDLFGVPAPTGFDQPVPTWRVLPEETRRVVTELMARLLDTSNTVRTGQRRSMMSDKIRPHHLDRQAILYVRQSSSHQVLHNRESRALQYAMRERLLALGWSEIEIIDDDLGRSAAGGPRPPCRDRLPPPSAQRRRA
jgi:hypothetical protein